MENQASIKYGEMCDALNLTDLNDPSVVVDDERDIAEGFKRIDHRRLVAAPESNRAEFLEQLRSWTHIGNEQPRWNLTSVLAVAGERLACCRLAIEFADGNSSEQNQVLLFDDSVSRLELLVSFDPDDADAAVAELRRLAEQVGAGTA